MLLCTAFLSVFVGLVAAGKVEDQVSQLPGLEFTPTFKQYSGYLSGHTENYQLHYWFVEAQSEPQNKPLVLWMNGGPGCSSLEGFLDENGPFKVVEGKKLIKNPTAWNQLANMLYLEAPAGVGFSYAADGNFTVDDDLTSLNNVYALKSFLKKFPEYKGRDFYITGESYGGVYVPTLAIRVLEAENLQLNLKGIAVGNGLTSYEMNDNSLMYFAAYHGLVAQKTWEKLLTECCDNDATKTKCLFTRYQDKGNCKAYITEVANVVNSGLDIYNLYSECAGGVPTLWGEWLTPNKGFYSLHGISPTVQINSDLGNLFRTVKHIQQTRQRKQLQRKRLNKSTNLVIPCVDDHRITNYLNDPEVKKAIHVSDKAEEEWAVCSDKINSNYIRTYQELSLQYKKIVNAGVRTLLYNGDVDMACNFIGDEWFVDSLGFDLVGQRKAWLYVEDDGTKQIGGFVKTFSTRVPEESTSLTYVTIRGSGHMAPTDKPRSTYHVYEAFINNSSV